MIEVMNNAARVFGELNAVNVNEKTEKKNGLTYLSWAWAWAEVKKRFPTANYTVYEDANGNNYHTDGMTCWVKTGVTIEGLEHIEYLPVMDFKNKSVPATNVTSTDVNKAIQRSLTKACARHGLGLYIYAGEDLPDPEREEYEQKAREEAGQPITELMIKALEKALEGQNVAVSSVLSKFKIQSLDQLTNSQYVEVTQMLHKVKSSRKGN